MTRLQMTVALLIGIAAIVYGPTLVTILRQQQAEYAAKMAKQQAAEQAAEDYVKRECAINAYRSSVSVDCSRYLDDYLYGRTIR